MPIHSHAAKLAAATAFCVLFSAAASAQTAGTRHSMERCVDSVLAEQATCVSRAAKLSLCLALRARSAAKVSLR